MNKWNVTLSLQTGVYMQGVNAHDPATLIAGDLNYEDVVTALIDQLQKGLVTIDYVVEEVQTLDGRVVRCDDEDQLWLGDAV